MRYLGLMAGVLAALAAGTSLAATPAGELARFEAEAKAAAPAFGGFSAQRGEAFFKATHGKEWSCATCHTAKPSDAGKHAVTGRRIAPLAPSANAERFSDSANVDKWFRRNCNDVVGRPCTALEKGDVLQFLMTVK